MKTEIQHPQSEQLLAFGHGMASPAEQAALEEHIASCDRCCQALEQLPDDPLMAQIRRSDTQGIAVSTQGLTGEPLPPLDAHDLPAELADHERLTVVRKLGSGGMGVVYLAEDELMGRLVAVKLLDSRLLDHEQAGKRFAKEVQMAGRLSHPNIVTAYDAAQIGRSPALVMEYVEGESLDRLVAARGPLPIGEAVDFARQTALGLAHAHENNWVHRDIKPQNLMATPSRQIKILDFGLARLVYGHDDDHQTNASLTARGAVLGTPDYIAPEQARDSKTIDHRVDIYSLGCTLYFLLAGRPPFVDGSSTEKLANHMMIEPPALDSIRPDLPRRLVELVRGMMAKKPEDRISSAAQVASTLEGIGSHLDTAPDGRFPTIVDHRQRLAPRTKTRRMPRRAWLAAAGAALLVATAGSAAYFGGAFDIPYTGPPRVLIIGPSDREMSQYNDLRRSIAYCKHNPTVTVASTADLGHDYFPVDLLLTDVDPQDFDVLYILGPVGAAEQSEFITDSQHQEQFARIAGAMLRDGKAVASLSTGTAALANAELLNGRTVADCRNVDPATKLSSGAQWVNKPVVRDEMLFTSRAEGDSSALVKVSLDHDGAKSNGADR